MAFRFKKTEHFGEAVRRVGSEQVARALAELDDPALSQALKVHQIRKRCKKIRGLLRLVRPALGDRYADENAWLRDTARLIAPLRDAETSRETLRELNASLTDSHSNFAHIERRLEQIARELTSNPQQVHECLQTVGERLRQQQGRIDTWTLQGKGFAVVRGGLRKTYTQARRGLQQSLAEPTSENLHRWRKRVKYHGYQCRLLKSLWPAMLAARQAEAERLGKWLGEDHDLAVLLQRAPPAPGDAAEELCRLEGLIAQRQQTLRRKAWLLGQRLFSEKPRRFVRRQETLWDLWSKVCS